MEEYIIIGQLIIERKALLKRIKELEEKLAKYQWISVDDKLPEIGKNVLLYDEIIRLGCREYGGWWADDMFFNDKEEFRYWMPLPEPPGNKEE